MNFNLHSHLEGKHSFLSPSNYHWINYSDEKLNAVYLRSLAVERGIHLHDLANRCIRLGVKLPRTKQTLNMFVNDAIGYRMNTEQILYYSENAFGTTDAISFKKRFLRIHDLKTGVTPASMNQLKVYAALFCLEYRIDIFDIRMELRIYQNDEVLVHEPESEEIKDIMDKIVMFDKMIEEIKNEVVL